MNCPKNKKIKKNKLPALNYAILSYFNLKCLVLCSCDKDAEHWSEMG